MRTKYSPKQNMIKNYTLILLLLLTILSTKAQDSTNTNKKFKLLSEFYMMFPNMNGVTGMGTLPEATVDLNPSDVFSHFKIGAMLYFEVTHDQWAFTSDLAYMHLKEDVKPGALINSGEVNVKQFSWEVAGLRRLLPWFEAGIGGRLNNLNNKLELQTKNVIGGGTTASDKQLTKTWFDPIIVTRVKGSSGKKFIYQFRGDLGGFGIGSDFAWQLQAYGGWQFTKGFQLTAGYRIISVDYEKGTGENYFKYDMDTFGPVVKFGFNF